MSPRGGPSGLAVVIVAVIFGAVGGAAAGYLVATRQLSNNPAPTVIAQPSSDPTPRTRVEVTTDKNAIVNAVDHVSPSVVKITGTREPRDFMELWMSGGMISGLGSGFIFEYEGRKLVLTNTHVIAEFTDFTLKLTDGRELKARPLGSMPNEDLAALEILDPPADLKAATLGDSDKLRSGEWVIAVGNPFNFEHTVTVGVVSAMGMREFRGEQRKVIQTDAAINAGNSGGPLVDLAGNVIGINYAIYDPQGNRVATTVGIGFAIPINQAKELLYFLVNRGPWVGLPTEALVPNSSALARAFGLGTDQGVVIRRTIPGSPADRAGLTTGDVILAVDGQPVSDIEGLSKLIFKHRIGDKILFTVKRGNQQAEVQVEAGTVPDDIYHFVS